MKLAKKNWEPVLYQKLTEVINEGKYTNQYVVFDWDNTCIINDVGELIYLYQLEHLALALTPTELGHILLNEMPETAFNPKWNNQKNQDVTVQLVAADILASYQVLYDSYEGFNGEQSLKEIQKLVVYQEFITKMRYLYSAIGDSFSADLSYPWVTYLLAGKTKKEISDLTEKAIQEGLKQPLVWETLISPQNLASKSGVVSVTFKKGIRLIPEIQDLIHVLKANQIAVYIVSASNEEIVRQIATDKQYGYGLSKVFIFGMRLAETDKGIMLPHLMPHYSQTQGNGKSITIRSLIAQNHDNQEPLIVAGDSQGDKSMLTDFAKTKISIIVERQQTGEMKTLCERAREQTSLFEKRYFLQGRDETAGTFLPQPTSRLLNK